MKNEKDNFKSAIAKMREAIDPEQVSLLDQIDRYNGELRRQSANLRSRIDELQGIVTTQRSKINDMTRFQEQIGRLEKQLASREQERKQLASEIDELRKIVPEWREIDESSSFINVKVKCLRCGLHFILCTWEPERHRAATIHCPECGQHHGHFMVWQAVPEEELIFQLVPGEDALVEMRIPKRG